ncbi:DUF4126 domain-containing protein [Sphingobacterium sp. E70]|nr:DUF4126 domain-containing protein [Sphingobacterium sp. E70]ULT23918.1 DUF4126 domain-containing protein [Sphingobacterium sp. E70]
MGELSTYLVSAFIGISLAAATGFRIFMPLFLLSLGCRLELFQVGNEWAWAGSNLVLITTSIAMVIEVAAYYIPLVDNILDTISIPLATIAEHYYLRCSLQIFLRFPLVSGHYRRRRNCGNDQYRTGWYKSCFFHRYCGSWQFYYFDHGDYWFLRLNHSSHIRSFYGCFGRFRLILFLREVWKKTTAKEA